jgi:hypothetical protein
MLVGFCLQLFFFFFLLFLHNCCRELSSRVSSGFDAAHVVGIIRQHDGDEDPRFAEEMARKGYPDYKYCLVLPFAERNLSTILAHEHIAGKGSMIQ